MILMSFDPIRALLLGIAFGFVGSVIFYGWVIFCAIRNKIRAKKGRRNKE